jgi:hypothetical protein
MNGFLRPAELNAAKLWNEKRREGREKASEMTFYYE